jgi:hypothetical protein
MTGIRSAQIPVIWSESSQNGRIPAGCPDLAKTARFRPVGRIWPERPDFGRLAGSARTSRPERPAGQTDQARTAGFRQISASMSEFGSFGRNPVIFGRNPANLDSDETIRIPAFILDSGYSSRNGRIR